MRLEVIVDGVQRSEASISDGGMHDDVRVCRWSRRAVVSSGSVVCLLSVCQIVAGSMCGGDSCLASQPVL